MIHFRVKAFFMLFQLVIMTFLSDAAPAQTKSGLRKIFREAESHFLFGEYELALPLYQKLENPGNFNVRYKIGVCYLNILGEKGKAVNYLELASENSISSARASSFKENRAPIDSYFFLGRAYMINNQLEKAVDTFNEFKKLASESKDKNRIKNLSYIDQEIEACNNTLARKEAPFRISRRPLGKDFRKEQVNEDPAVSFDGNSLVFTERKGQNNSIMYSLKKDGKWQTPVKINTQLKCGDDCSSCSLNRDGTLLFLYKTDNFDGNIYSSELIDGVWTPVKKLNNNINTRFYESHAAISADNNRLYFSSNRDGGLGELDIYVSERDLSGDWGPATNIGDIINTPYNEDNPFITINDSILYFSSEGHNGMGGYDIFRSLRTGNSWETPLNLGYPLNSTDEDKFFQPFNNDENGYYSMVTGSKRKNIFYITLTNPRLKKIFELTGKYGLKESVEDFDENNSIYLIDRVTGDTLDTGIPENNTGNYNFITAPGYYRLIYTGPAGYYSQFTDTTIADTNTSQVIKLQDIILDSLPHPQKEIAYEKIDLSKIPEVPEVDPDILIRDVQALDVTDSDSEDPSILFYTVQVMALHNPVDATYFKFVNDIRVLYNNNDRFYRYTTGHLMNKNDAYKLRDSLISMGYPDDLFIKKVTKIGNDQPVAGRKYFSVQIKAVRTPLNIEATFPGLTELKEVKEMDGLYHYLFGRYTSTVEAAAALRRVKELGYADAFIREVNVTLDK